MSERCNHHFISQDDMDIFKFGSIVGGDERKVLESAQEAMLDLRDIRSREERGLHTARRIVAPSSTIWSDEWAAYRQLSSLGYQHETVNHSENFTDPTTGTCTNHVEAYWCAVKRRFKTMVGTTQEMLPSYLDEHMWRERYTVNENGGKIPP